MKMLQNQMDSISLDVAQISAHAKAQVKSILEVSIHMHLLGTLYTDLLHICMLLYVIVWYCMFILFCVKCIQCSMVPIRLYVSTLFNPVRPKQILRRLCSMLTLGIADEMIQFTLMHVNTQLFPLLVCCKKIEFYITFYPCLLWSRPCCGAQTCFVALILEMSWTWFDMICVAAIDAILLPCVFVCGGKIFLTLEINICDESMMPQPRSNWSSGILLEMSS